ncbi:hypothetical protein [Paracoccus amoyensis]|uniref:hypothetical protein n=1 Tax=Paracoccus amoyensis TaxID=2760093 RepID=UPI00165959C3|nr:hypothetical protein [Paracoccus amoyensis]
MIGASVAVRTNTALIKGSSLLPMGLWVFGWIIWRMFFVAAPEAQIMGLVLSSAFQIMRQAMNERRVQSAHAH